ncbi:MAG: phosphate acyltransferase PlsX [Bacteroidales bacterium]|nr:phosphate acyltransferase PlsX [Bacteroidales bacterium]
MILGLDVMGGDHAPGVTIAGAVDALDALPQETKIALFGPRDVILTELGKHNADPQCFDIVECPEVIAMGESPIRAFAAKPYSSIAIGFKFLKNKKIDAFSSAGDTGVMFVGAINNVERIPGIIRPCISTVVPREDGKVNLLLDVGLNPDCRVDVMYQFAILGYIYSKYILKIPEPKVGLLNIGAEEKKGSILTQSVHQILKDASELNFVGNVEGIEMFTEKADVIVTDGFTGNIVLKQMEAMTSIIVRRGLRDSYIDSFNYENFGGTPILGINAPVFIGHGKSSAKAIKNMILASQEMVHSNLIKNFKKAFKHISL